MAFDSLIEQVRAEKIDLEMECNYDFITGRGIRLQSVESFDKKNQKIHDGLQSDFFGTDFGDDAAFQERYRCKCGKYTGKMYEGYICEDCDQPVEYHDADLTRTGWIIIDYFRVLSPIYAQKLDDALGASNGERVLDKILEIKYHEEGEDQNIEAEMTDKELKELKKHPFMHKGMRWLNKHILEVLEYYRKKKPTKKDLFDELINDKYIMFTSCLPVYTSLLRTELPGEKGSKVFKIKINTIYQSIIRIANFINKFSPDSFDERTLQTIDIQLSAINKEIKGIFNETYKELTGKKGLIATKVLGGKYNFSARNIIVPSSGRLRADEIEVGYLTFMELYRYEIVNLYAKLNSCTIKEASDAWKKGLMHPNETLLKIIKHMTTDEEYKKHLWVLINRNPSINYGSFILMRIAGIKDSLTDKTMTLPSNCLKSMNADFDGDVLNLFRIIGIDLAKRFGRNLNPRYNLYISKMNGKVNMDTLPFKDEIIGFFAFNTI